MKYKDNEIIDSSTEHETLIQKEHHLELATSAAASGTVITNPLSISGMESQEEQARQLHEELIGLARKSIQTILKLGRTLSELKKAVPRGKWEKYVKESLSIHHRRASNFMRLAQEWSTIEQVGKLTNSTTATDIGIREALNILAKRKKAEKSAKSKNGANSKDQNRDKESTGSKSKRSPLTLADGSKLAPEKYDWREGLISREALARVVSDSTGGVDDPAHVKIKTREQRVIVAIAAGINRSIGKVKPEKALPIIEAALNAVRSGLQEAHNQAPEQQ